MARSPIEYAILWSYGWKLAVALGVFALSNFLRKGYVVRMKYRRLEASGITMLPHSLLFGHLLILMDSQKELPSDLNFVAFPLWLKENYKRYLPKEESMPAVIYFDMWPFFESPAVLTFESSRGTQFHRDNRLSKHPILGDFLKPLTDNRDIVTTSGDYWKTWRSRLNPAFVPRIIMAQVPEIMEEVEIFTHRLAKLAGPDGGWGPVFKLEELTTDLTLDIISRAIVGVSLGEQTGGSAFKPALLKMIHLMESGGDVSRGFNPFGRSPWQNREIARLNDIMRHALVPDDLTSHFDPNHPPTAAKPTILNRLLQNIFDQTGQMPDALDIENYKSLVSNMKALVFAGFDTTASMLCWIVKLLQDHPEALRKLQSEHDEILGKDILSAKTLLTQSPHLLNSLKYTNAVIKETLRLYPIAFAIRSGTPGAEFFLTSAKSGLRHPTDGFGVWDAIAPIQRDPDLWVQPDDFLPERWLVGSDDPLYVPNDAWRPFSAGQRICIGQDLAIVEAKLMTVFVSRTFDIEEAWAEWDRENNVKDKPTWKGQRLYPAGLGTMHPKDGLPCHIRRRKQC